MLFNRRMLSCFALAASLSFAGVAAAETFKVGAYPTNPPWEFKNEQGQFDGFEVDLAKEIAKRNKWDITIDEFGFQALFAATASGRIDAAISSISITKERLKSQSFTQGYYDSDSALGTRGDSKIKSLADTKGAVIGVLATSVGETLANQIKEKYGFKEVRGYKVYQDMLLDLQNGRADAVISDIAGLQFSFVKMKDLKVAERIPVDDKYGMMLPKGSKYLAPVNDTITAMKKDGTLAAIHKKWFGVEADAATSTVQARPLPSAD